MTAGTVNPSRVYDNLLADVRSRVEEGELEAEQMLPSEKVLASNHNISRWAVREALNVLAGEGLIERIPGRGTIVVNTRSANRVRTRNLATVVDVTVEMRSNSYALELLQHIRCGNAKQARPFAISYHFHDFSEDESFLDGLKEDLVVVLPFSERCQSQLEQRQSHGPARVLCLGRELNNEAVPQVYVDHKTGTRRATEYLVGIGHERILMMAPPSYPGGFSNVRHKAFVQTMRESGLPSSAIMTGYCPDHQDVYELIAENLAMSPSPTAIFVAAGSLAGPTMHALARMGKRVPEDLSVLTYDDMPELRAFSPPLTAVRQPLAEVAGVLLKTLDAYMETGRLARIRSAVRPELIVRESCRRVRRAVSSEGGVVGSLE